METTVQIFLAVQGREELVQVARLTEQMEHWEILAAEEMITIM